FMVCAKGVCTLRRNAGGATPEPYEESALADARDARASGRRPGPPAQTQVARFVSALARAVQAFHTYPPGSPSRGDVIEVARDTLRPCIPRDEDSISIDVTSQGLSVADEPLVVDRGPERALAIALRRAYVSTLEIRAGASTRDFRQFCALIAFPDELLGREEDLPEILAQRGVTHIIVHVISSHQTIEGGTVPSALLDLVQRHRDGAGRSADSAEGGWIRLDPSVPLERVTLEDLPLLLRDAPSLGVALDRMSRTHGSVSPADALVLHYEEITDLYAACGPSLSDTLFRRLAGVVHELPEETKLALLKEKVLPGLVDGRRSGRILKHFSEAEVADALWLLLDLGVGGVEMLTAGLASLDLPESRLEGVVERVSRRLEGEADASPDWSSMLHPGGAGPGADDPGDRLTINEEHDADFLALRTFDLSVDEASADHLAQIVGEVAGADPVAALLQCCADILALSADPSIIAATLRRSRGLFLDLESRGDAAALADWLARYASIARGRDSLDGEVSALIHSTLDQYVTPEFIHRVSALPNPPDREAPLVTIICELGRTGVGALVDSLAVESDRSARNRLLTALQPRAPGLAEYLVDYLSHPEWYVVRNILTLLGYAGPGYEEAVAELVDHEHPRVIREAFIALARIGSEEAINRTTAALYDESDDVRKHAADAIWRFEPTLSHPRLLEVMRDRRLALAHPGLVTQLVVAAGKRDLAGLEPVLRRLQRHCLAIWNPERRSLGWHALRQLRASR
ncbi:MAG: HEAT repeat domain-containing protein, partial [Gemmatimonadota bacterium]